MMWSIDIEKQQCTADRNPEARRAIPAGNVFMAHSGRAMRSLFHGQTGSRICWSAQSPLMCPTEEQERKLAREIDAKINDGRKGVHACLGWVSILRTPDGPTCRPKGHFALPRSK
jgi:hypothetical protein